MRFFTEDELRNYYKKVIEEGEYATEITVGEYSTPQEANAVLDTIRKQYGFGRYDSRVDGTSVKVVIEKDPNDDSYFPDMINQMKNFGKQYKQVAENKKSKNMKKKITESQLRNIIAESVKNVLMSEGLFGGVKTAKNANDVNAMFQELRSAVPNELQFTNATYPSLNEPAYKYLQSMKQKIESTWQKAQEAYNEIVRGGRMDNYLLGNFNNCYRIIMQDCNTRTMKNGLKTAWKSYKG